MSDDQPMTAAEMGRRRMAKLTAAERRELTSRAGKASAAKMTREQLQARGRAGALKREANRKAKKRS